MNMSNRIVELRQGIYQFEAARPSSNVYLVMGTSKNLLIDTGMAVHFPKLKGSLSQVGLAIEDIHLIVLTHEHFDHIGAAAYFPEKTIIAAHRLAANKIHMQDEFVMMRKYFDVPARAFNADLWIDGDSVFDLGNYRLRTIHTPGHCSGCICLYEPGQRLLFTGDTISGGGQLSGIFPSGSISDYVDSIGRLLELRIEELYPGHGPISTNPQEDLQRASGEARVLLEDSRALFEALDTRATFKSLFASVRKPPRKEPLKS
jgi:hydroxyacylglutathione hydrolase